MANYQSYTGIFSEVKSIYANVATRIKDQHHIGIIVRGENESEFFKRSRVYGQYAVHIPLSATWSLRGGIAMGWVNYHFPTSPASVGGSDGAIDGTVGLALTNERNYLGFSIHQFPNQSLAPITFTYVLEPYYEGIGQHRFELTPHHSITINLRARVSPATSHVFYGGILWKIKERLLLGMGTRNASGLTAAVGCTVNYTKQQHLELLFHYYQPIGNSRILNVANYEIMAQFHLDKVKS